MIIMVKMVRTFFKLELSQCQTDLLMVWIMAMKENATKDESKFSALTNLDSDNIY